MGNQFQNIAIIIISAVLASYSAISKPLSDHCFFPFDNIELSTIGTRFPISWMYSFDKIKFNPIEGNYSDYGQSWYMPFSYSDSIYFQSQETKLTQPDLIWDLKPFDAEVAETLLFGDTLYCLGKNGKLKMLRISSKSLIKEADIAMDAIPYCMAITGGKAYIGIDSSFIIWDIESGVFDYTKNNMHKFNGVVRSVAAINNVVVFAGMDGTLRRYNPDTESMSILIDKSGSDNFYSAAMSDDGRFAAAGSYFGNIYFYDFYLKKIDSITGIHGNNGNQSVIWDLAFDRLSKRIISTGVDAKLAYSDFANGKLKEFAGQTLHNRCCGYFDDELVWAAGLDSTLMMWSLKTGNQTPLVLKHNNPVVSADYDAQTFYLALGGRQGGVRVWKFSPSNQIQNLYARRIKYRFNLAPSEIRTSVGRSEQLYFITDNIYHDSVQSNLEYELTASIDYDKDVLYFNKINQKEETNVIKGRYKLIRGKIDSLNGIFLSSTKSFSALNISGKEIDTSRWEVSLSSSQAITENRCQNQYGIGISMGLDKQLIATVSEGRLSGSFNTVETGIYQLSVSNYLGQILFEKKYYSSGGGEVKFDEKIEMRSNTMLIINLSAPSFIMYKKIING